MKNNLILLNGTLCDERLWSHQVEHLSGDLSIQIPALTYDDTIARMAERVLASAPAWFALAGFSMGGSVAFEIMRQAPRRVTKLALLDTHYLPLSVERMAEFRKMLAQVRAGNSDDALGMVARMTHPDRRSDSRLMNTILAMGEEAGAAVFIRQVKALMTRPDYTPVLNKITVPTVYIAGRQDTWCDVALHQQMQGLTPGARLFVVEDCGHVSPMEQPEAVTNLLSHWLQE